MDGEVRSGDVIVCRVNGTFDFYVIGIVVSGKVGELSLRGVSTTNGQDSALQCGYEARMFDRHVWLFDGAAAAYVKTSRPKSGCSDLDDSGRQGSQEAAIRGGGLAPASSRDQTTEATP